MRLALACLLLALSGLSSAQPYPQRPVTLVVGFTPGGNVDGVARIYGPVLSEALKQPVIIENRAGAGGAIGAAQVAKAPPDGHTLLVMPAGFAASATLHRKLPYDSEKDFRVAAALVTYPFTITVNANSPHKTLSDLIKAARDQPGKVDYGTGGVGTGMHLAAELMLAQTGTKMNHVPYKGGTADQTALLGGEIPVIFSTPSVTAPLHLAGKFRMLAVMSAQRFPGTPNVPTVAESVLPGFDVSGWMMLAAPRGTPDAVIARLNDVVNGALRGEELRTRLVNLGVAPANPSSPDGAQKFVLGEISRWRKVILDAGIPIGA